MENITQNTTIQEIVADKAFLEKIIKLGSIDEVREEFKKRGLNLSDEDIETIGELVRHQIEDPTYISEDILKKTTGGWSDPDFIKFKNISIGVACLAIGLSVAHAVTSSANTVNYHATDFRQSWLWKAVTFRGTNTFKTL